MVGREDVYSQGMEAGVERTRELVISILDGSWDGSFVPSDEDGKKFVDTLRGYKRILDDDPELDCTPLSHSAYYRGEIAGVRGVIQRVRDIMEGRDTGSGVLGDADLESLRRYLLKVCEYRRDSDE